MPKYAGRTLGAVIVVLALVAIALAAGAAVRRYDRYLAGLWAGDPGFLKKAQLLDLQLFVAPRPAGRGERQGYLIITDESGEFVSNQAVEIRERLRWGSALRASLRTEKDACRARYFEIEYDRDGSDGKPGAKPPMPERLEMTLSVLDGTLTLYDGEKVYAFLQKDLAASAAAVEAYSA
jgi:hypothetical protein